MGVSLIGPNLISSGWTLSQNNLGVATHFDPVVFELNNLWKVLDGGEVFMADFNEFLSYIFL